MKRAIFAALLLDLILTLAAVFGFLWITGSDEEWECFAGYFYRDWYTHSMALREHVDVAGAQSVWFCFTGEARYFGVEPPEGAVILNTKP